MGKMENPGALAGETGAKKLSKHFNTEEYRVRALATSALSDAIAQCLREDLVVIFEGLLERLRAGEPTTPLLSYMDEARDWAAYATPGELKCYLVAIWNALSKRERARFLAYVLQRTPA